MSQSYQKFHTNTNQDKSAPLVQEYIYLTSRATILTLLCLLCVDLFIHIWLIYFIVNQDLVVAFVEDEEEGQEISTIQIEIDLFQSFTDYRIMENNKTYINYMWNFGDQYSGPLNEI